MKRVVIVAPVGMADMLADMLAERFADMVRYTPDAAVFVVNNLSVESYADMPDITWVIGYGESVMPDYDNELSAAQAWVEAHAKARGITVFRCGET